MFPKNINCETVATIYFSEYHFQFKHQVIKVKLLRCKHIDFSAHTLFEALTQFDVLLRQTHVQID